MCSIQPYLTFCFSPGFYRDCSHSENSISSLTFSCPAISAVFNLKFNDLCYGDLLYVPITMTSLHNVTDSVNRFRSQYDKHHVDHKHIHTHRVLCCSIKHWDYLTASISQEAKISDHTTTRLHYFTVK